VLAGGIRGKDDRKQNILEETVFGWKEQKTNPHLKLLMKKLSCCSTRYLYFDKFAKIAKIFSFPARAATAASTRTPPSPHSTSMCKSF
jgi:hypothetical protein